MKHDTTKKKRWRFLGYVWVDSGQLLITDPAYPSEWVGDKYDPKTWPSKSQIEEGESPYSYNGACAVTIESKSHCGFLREGLGFAVSTIFGDGSVAIYGHYNDDGQVDLIMIDMIPDLLCERDRTKEDDLPPLNGASFFSSNK